MTLAPGSKLGPYEILAPIGSGGMGEVWKARDTRLGRMVAIKTVKEQHSERFKQEAHAIAALNHPYICQLFDIGPDYLVLEYVEGKPLSGPLPEKEAVRLAIQIAAALEAAHKKGIVHRDLKPGNVMVTEEGSVKLLDFGLAKLYEQDTSSSNLSTADLPATQAGAVLGTIAYMSPEQAQGQPADARSDIFSFGLVLYEMVSGRRAFSGDSNYAVMDALVKKDPPALEASAALTKIVRRCLAKQPSGRYEAMLEVRTVLEQVFGEKATIASAAQQPSIAVLPFVNMSGDKEQEYFSDGLAEEIINALAQIPGLKVIARTSAFAFRGKEQDITKIAETLRVRTILEGSVRKAGNRVRVTAQLIDAADGSHIWSERYDRELTDVFAIQDEISQAIAEKLRVKLAADRPLVKRYTESVEAYNLYLKGRYYLTKFTQEGFAKSKEYYEQAIALDPKYALAWYGLAWFYFNLDLLGYMVPKSAHAQSSQALRKALELDEMLPQVHCLMGMLHAVEFDWKGAEKELQRALELDPKSSDVWRDYQYWFLIPMRRLDEAVDASRKAIELDPLSPFLKQLLGHGYWLARKPDRAIEEYRSALELDPHYFLAYLQLGVVYVSINKHDEGVRAAEMGAQLSGRSAMALGYLGFVYASAGRVDEANDVLKELFQLAQKSYVPPWSFGIIYLALGEIDKGLDWLETAVDDRYAGIVNGSFNPMLAPLRSHPRFHALLRKMNLEP